MTAETTTKANITLKLNKDLLRRARVLAAKLEETLSERARYEEAKKHALAVLHKACDLNWKRPWSRDELHERSILR